LIICKPYVQNVILAKVTWYNYWLLRRCECDTVIKFILENIDYNKVHSYGYKLSDKIVSTVLSSTENLMM
jgi:hypothetical protein